MDDLISAKDVPEPLIEASVVHEIFRGIGVPAKDIYLDLQHLPEVRVVAVVGGTAYAIVVYKSWMEDPGVDLPELWEQSVRSWNAGCNDPSSGWHEAFESSNMRREAVDIIAILVVNGAKL